MTERKYECYAELWKYNIPQGMDGEVMTLREWLLAMRKYKKYFEEIDDESILGYIATHCGKYLIEV